MPMLTYDSAMQQIASQNKPSNLEDSSLAIELCVRSSWRGRSIPAELFREYQSEFVPWSIPRSRPSATEAVAASSVLGAAILSSDKRRDIDPFAAAFFSEALLQRLGIETAHSRIVPTNEAQKLTSCIVKFSRNSKLRWNAPPTNDYALVCDVIPDAASVDYIRRVRLSAGDASLEESATQFLSLRAGGKISDAKLARVFALISKTCKHSDALFSGVDISDEQVRVAGLVTSFKSERWFRIAVARIFLGCTAPHFANVLVTRNGQLVSIDHDSCRFESGKDLRLFFFFIRRGSHIFNLVGSIAKLTNADIREAVAAIPDHPAFAFDSLALSAYFRERLALWQALCAGKLEPTRDLAAVV
jgi:hypothetical protein